MSGTKHISECVILQKNNKSVQSPGLLLSFVLFKVSFSCVLPLDLSFPTSFSVTEDVTAPPSVQSNKLAFIKLL